MSPEPDSASAYGGDRASLSGSHAAREDRAEAEEARIALLRTHASTPVAELMERYYKNCYCKGIIQKILRQAEDNIGKLRKHRCATSRQSFTKWCDAMVAKKRNNDQLPRGAENNLTNLRRYKWPKDMRDGNVQSRC